MNSPEEDDNLHLDYFIEREDNRSKRYKKSTILIKNELFTYGFFELSNNCFYQIHTLQTATMKMKSSRMLQISTKDKEKGIKYSFLYNLIENPPTITTVELDQKSLLSFRYPPKCFINNCESPSSFLIEYYNQSNNSLVLDSPYRHLLFNCDSTSTERINHIKNHLLFSAHKVTQIAQLTIDSFSQYKLKLNALLKLNSDFNTNYMAYANISEIILRKKTESCISVLTNYRNELTFESLSKYNDNHTIANKNKMSFFIMKHIQITPTMVKIRKEMFHQPSRFLRLYYSNDNFIKVEFKDESDSQLYTNNSSSSNLHLLYHKVFTEGLHLCDKHYVFFLNPTNAMRSNSLWLIESSEARDKLMYYYNELGLSNLQSQHPLLCFPKLLARLSQNFTSTSAFTGDFTTEIINDLKTQDGNGIYNDGCGKISLELLKDICGQLNRNVFESAIQIRYKGSKGVLVVSPNLKGRCIQLTGSMVKFNCNNTNDLEVIRFSKYSPGYLNLQIIILLIMNRIKKKVIYSIAKKEVIAYKKRTCFYEPGFDRVIKNIEIENIRLKSQKEYMSNIAKSTYIYNRLSNISKKYRFHMKNCGFFIGVIDFDSILKENEVFIQLKTPSGKTKIITRDIIITKNPCLSLYDIQKVTGVNNEYFASLFFNVIIFPSKGHIPLPSKISGSDLDGDIYWVCWDKRLTPIHKRDYNLKYDINYNNKVITQKEKYKVINTNRIRKQFININKRGFKVDETLSIQAKCLQFHCYFHHNYKLPDVNKQYLTIVNSMFKGTQYKDDNYLSIQRLEEQAVYHSIEVDFQKTGETSDFKLDCNYPTYLTKKHLRSKMSFLFQIKEIHEDYTYDVLPKTNANINASDNRSNNEYNNFYDYFIKTMQTEKYDFNRKHLRLYQKKLIDRDMAEKSFIYKIYELVSFTTPLRNAFMNLIYLMSDEFFYDSKLSEMQFSFEGLSNNEIMKLLSSVKSIASVYENELKYIMRENDLVNEIELAYMINYFEPKIPIFKNDIEDYRASLIQQLGFIVNKSIFDLTHLNTQYTHEHISSALFIAIYWIEGIGITINSERNLMIDNIIKRSNKIVSIRDFIERVVHHSTIDKMKLYLYDNLKSLTLLNFFLNNIYSDDN